MGSEETMLTLASKTQTWFGPLEFSSVGWWKPETLNPLLFFYYSQA